MRPEDGTSAQLATFDPPLAQAVATVLRREGVPVTVEPLGHSEVEVLVPATRRDEALVLLAAHMEEIRDLVDGGRRGAAPTTSGTVVDPDDDEAGGPMVMERFRRMGFGLALVLAPLLVITLAAPELPLGYALVVFLAGLVAVVYWHNRQQD